jgi:hypothetical protein
VRRRAPRGRPPLATSPSSPSSRGALPTATGEPQTGVAPGHPGTAGWGGQSAARPKARGTWRPDVLRGRQAPVEGRTTSASADTLRGSRDRRAGNRTPLRPGTGRREERNGHPHPPPRQAYGWSRSPMRAGRAPPGARPPPGRPRATPGEKPARAIAASEGRDRRWHAATARCGLRLRRHRSPPAGTSCPERRKGTARRRLRPPSGAQAPSPPGRDPSGSPGGRSPGRQSGSPGPRGRRTGRCPQSTARRGAVRAPRAS